MFFVRSCIRLNVIQCNGFPKNHVWLLQFDINFAMALIDIFQFFLLLLDLTTRQEPMNDFAIVISTCLLFHFCSSEFRAMNRWWISDFILMVYSMKRSHDCFHFRNEHFGIMMSCLCPDRKSIQIQLIVFFFRMEHHTLW